MATSGTLVLVAEGAIRGSTEVDARRPIRIVLAVVAVAALAGAVAILAIPVGVIADSDCGWPIQAALRNEISDVCNPPGQARVALAVVLLIVAVASTWTSWRLSRRS